MSRLHAIDLGRTSALPLEALLSAIPSFPRPILERLVARMIEQLDEQDGDPDLEDDDPGEDENDAELEEGFGPSPDAYGIDQRRMTHWGGKYSLID